MNQEEKYVRNQNECGLKIGDIVKITRQAKSHEQGWNNSWVENMLKPGKTSVITGIGNGTGIHLKSGFAYPYFVLKKVNPLAAVEILGMNETWVNSCNTKEEIKIGKTFITNTKEYEYYADLNWGHLYRVKLEEVKLTYHIGQKFLCDGTIYALCTPENQKIGLIAPETGHRWGESTEVKNIHKITAKEMLEHTSSWNKFVLMEK